MFVSLTREHQFLKNSNKGGPQAGPHTLEELADERKEVGSGDRQGRGEEDVTKKHIIGEELGTLRVVPRPGVAALRTEVA